jgi:hypothetical protein
LLNEPYMLACFAHWLVISRVDEEAIISEISSAFLS